MSTGKCNIVDRILARSTVLVALLRTWVSTVKGFHTLFLTDQACVELWRVAWMDAFVTAFETLATHNRACGYLLEVFGLLYKMFVLGVSQAFRAD